jgi:hypothetical protein
MSQEPQWLIQQLSNQDSANNLQRRKRRKSKKSDKLDISNKSDKPAFNQREK